MEGLFDLSRLCDDWLQKGFKLDTNLSKICGPRLSSLIDSLDQFSSRKINKRIIELVMYESHVGFMDLGTIQRLMTDNNRVVKTFTILGNHDINCTMRWLINTLNMLGELKPLLDILGTAVPSIILRSPLSGQTAGPGENIEFQIRTISEAHIQWIKFSNRKMEIVKDHVNVNKGSVANICYELTESDHGTFRIHVSCKENIEEFSESVIIDICNNTSTASRPLELCSDGIQRIALLIGVMEYDEETTLTAPEADIFDLEDVLLSIGFSVFCFGELNGSQMKRILDSFTKSQIKENSYIFFYFAGHGRHLNNIDHMVLRDSEEIKVVSVLETLLSAKPKVLISIFDMCRTNGPKQAPPLVVAQLPVCDNLLMVMATLPLKPSYESADKFDYSSLIIKPLCESLRNCACKYPISYVLTNFLNLCENIKQRPIISGTGIRDIVGQNICMKRIELEYEWIEKPENPKIIECVFVDFKIFHNILQILIFRTSRIAIEIVDKRSHNCVRWETEIVPGGTRSTINLFYLKNKLKNKNELFMPLLVHDEGKPDKCYNIKILFPQQIIDIL